MNGIKHASEMPDIQACVNRLAVNEDGVLGFITSVKTVGKTTIFIGFDMKESKDWASMDPLVIQDQPAFESIIDCAGFFAPEEPPGVHIKMMGPPPTFNTPFDKDVFGKLNKGQAQSFHDLLNDLFNPQGLNGGNAENGDSVKDWEFRLDNDDEDPKNDK